MISCNKIVNASCTICIAVREIDYYRRSQYSNQIRKKKYSQLFFAKSTIEISTKMFQTSIPEFIIMKKVRPSKTNLVYSMLPLYYCSRAIGLLPFSIVCNPNGEIVKARVRLIDLLWFVISIGFYIFLATFRYLTSTHFASYLNRGSVLMVGDNIILIFGLVYGAVTIIIDMHNRHRIIEMFKKIAIFDNQVSNK